MSEDPARSGPDVSDREGVDPADSGETNPAGSDADAWGAAAGPDAEGAADDVESERADDDAEARDATDEEDPSIAGVFGARPDDAPPREDLVPESVDLENALFLLLGVLFGLFVIYRAVVVFTA